MLTCLRGAKTLCALDVCADNILNYNLKKELRVAGREGELVCSECGQPVLLRAGIIRTPHFAHRKQGYAKVECAYADYQGESENHRKGKQIIYSYFKTKYPKEAFVQAEKKLSTGRRADVYVVFVDGQKLAVELQLSNLPFEDWVKRHEDYTSIGVKDIWMLFGTVKRFKEEIKEYELSFLEQFLAHESSYHYGLYLDIEKKELVFMKPTVFSEDGNIEGKLIVKSYPLNEVLILPNGEIKTGFLDHYETKKQDFYNHCKEKFSREKTIVEAEVVHPWMLPRTVRTTSRIGITDSQRGPKYVPWDKKIFTNVIYRVIRGREYDLNTIKNKCKYGSAGEAVLIGIAFKEFYQKGYNLAKGIYFQLRKEFGGWLVDWDLIETESINHETLDKPGAITDNICSNCRFVNNPMFKTMCDKNLDKSKCRGFSPVR